MKTIRRAFARDTRGSTAIEFSIVALPVILVLLTVLEFAMITWRISILDNAALDLANLVRQGNANAQTYRRKFCDSAGSLVNCDSNLQLAVNRLQSNSPRPAANINSTYNANPTQPFVVRVGYRHRFFTPFVDRVIPGRALTTRLVLYGVPE